MSDSHGCDAGGHDCAHAASGGEPGYALGTDGRTPIPNFKLLEINGAPVIEQSHQFVLKKKPDPHAQD